MLGIQLHLNVNQPVPSPYKIPPPEYFLLKEISIKKEIFKFS